MPVDLHAGAPSCQYLRDRHATPTTTQALKPRRRYTRWRYVIYWHSSLLPLQDPVSFGGLGMVYESRIGYLAISSRLRSFGLEFHFENNKPPGFCPIQSSLTFFSSLLRLLQKIRSHTRYVRCSHTTNYLQIPFFTLAFRCNVGRQ